MEVSRRDLALGFGVAMLLAVGIVRTAVPDRSRMRPLSIKAITLPSTNLGANATDVAEADWSPPTDVYVVGWSYHVPSHAGVLTLTLPPGETLLFRVRGGETEVKPQFMAAGTGYRLRKGDKLRARLEVTTLETPGKTHGGMVLVYFVPVEGN